MTTTTLRLFTSNRLELLADQLAAVMRAPLESIFEPEVVVVQSQGMARWLQFELARRLGVCANARFPFPRSFAWELFRAADSALPKEPDGEPEVLAWRLMRLLPAHATQRAFAPVAEYLKEDAEGRKRFQLARRLANLFDQYLIYRPDLILRWERGEAGPGEEWQAALWRELAKETRMPHPARLRETFAVALREGRLGKLPSRLSIFGISALPPFYVELFEELAQRVPVNVFLLQPTPEYWGDIDSARSTMRKLRQAGRQAKTPSDLHFHAGNRLLASLGNQGRDFLNVLLGATEFDVANCFEAPAEDSLLRRVQSDIFHLRDAGAPNASVAVNDDSLQIHSCHSPLRELEVLRDQMLSWFERDPALAPHDILVMMPDIETYAPFIEAVFGASASDRRFIPFSVADRGSSASSHVLTSFLALLKLAGGRLGASEVLALLEAHAVRPCFGIAESDLPHVRRWVDEAGIRWGRDAAHRAQLDLPALAENTWRHGLERLLIGSAIPRGATRLIEGIVPCDCVEGRHGETLGGFVRFAEFVFAAVEELEQSRPLGAWVELLRRLADGFFLDEESTAAELRVLRGALRDLDTHARLANFVEPLPLAVLLEHLEPALAEDHLQSGFITGRVTFGALKPMRSIPFKIICLVGMNDCDFPRADTRAGFDLMARAPRLGDQSRREDDRYLFLETLLSARQKLYISHVGQSVRDNSPAPPSVLVSELLDYVEEGYELEGRAGCPHPAGGGHEPVRRGEDTAPYPESLREHLVTRHRLQAFSEEYFHTDGRLFSYSKENFDACLALRANAAPGVFVPEKLSPPDDSWRTVAVEQLVEFFRNPAKFFARHRLNLRLPRAESALADREPIEIDGLDRYGLKSELLARRLAGASFNETRALLKAAGRLPHGSVGEGRYRELCDEVEDFHERLRPFHPGACSEPQPVDFALGPFLVRGELRPTPAGLLVYRPAKIKAKDMVCGWVQHLVWQIAGASAAGPTVVVGEEGNGRSVVRFKAVPGAKLLLEGLLALYWHGLSEPLRFFPESSLAFAEKAAATDAALAAAHKKWTSTEHSRGEEADEYFALCFRGADPLDEDFAAIARAVFTPLLQHEEVLE